MSEPAAKSVVKAFLQAVGNSVGGDGAGITPYLADDVRWHLPQSSSRFGPTDICGLAAVLTLITKQGARFYQPGSMRFDFHSMIAEGDYVHTRMTLEAMTSTGKPYCNEYQTLYRVAGGKLAEVWELYDTAYQFPLYEGAAI